LLLRSADNRNVNGRVLAVRPSLLQGLMMQLPDLSRFLLFGTLFFAAGCNNGDPAVSNLPTSPTPPAAGPTALVLGAISAVPDGAGVQYNTDFQFTADGSFPSGTQFVWRFGDGSSTTTNTPTASRVYGLAGVFDVSVEARSGGTTASSARQVSVRSLLGRWFGTVTGHTSFPPLRPQAITGFELQVVEQTRSSDGQTLTLRGRWADSAGCRESRDEFLKQVIQPEPSATVTFGVSGLSCASGDLYLTGLADGGFNIVEGHCSLGGGPNCRFSMRRE
jgi:hypothetical protein